MTTINLAYRAYEGKLTVEEVNAATKEKLEDKDLLGYIVLYWASRHCEIEVVESILDKNVNIDGLSPVSIVVGTCIITKLTLLLKFDWKLKMIG
jgi:hypothetical protein